ncbi:MAG: hypothetical protein PGN09_00825 [Sphingomonas fennica]
MRPPRLVLLPLLLAALLPAMPALAAGPAPRLATAGLDEAPGSAAVIASDAAARRALDPFRPRQTAYGLTLVLSDATFAAAGLRGTAPLAALATYALADPAIRLRVAGHADLPTGPATARARSRAAAVVAAMIAAGVARSRIELVDAGADYPLAFGDAPADRIRNRRVEITLLGEQAAPRVAMR